MLPAAFLAPAPPLVGGQPRPHPPLFLIAVWPGDLDGDRLLRRCARHVYEWRGSDNLQVVVASIFGIGCLVTKVFFVHQFGISGVPWATIRICAAKRFALRSLCAFVSPAAGRCRGASPCNFGRIKYLEDSAYL